jgi:hypothetical protein
MTLPAPTSDSTNFMFLDPQIAVTFTPFLKAMLEARCPTPPLAPMTKRD